MNVDTNEYSDQRNDGVLKRGTDEIITCQIVNLGRRKYH